MPHFCKCGGDEYICQVCGKVRCSREQPSKWLPELTGSEQAGNVCPECFENSTSSLSKDDFIDCVAKEFFGTTRSEAIKKKDCIRCGKKAGLFKTMKAVMEYQRTAFCQKCQEEV